MNHRRMCRGMSVSILVVGLTQFGVPASSTAQAIPGYGPNAKACALLPVPDLEAVYGGKAGTPRGTDGSTSICSVTVGTLVVKLQSAPPGTAGVPASIQQGIMGAKAMMSEAKDMPPPETKDFGKVGCVSMKLKGFLSTTQPQPLITTSCFLVEGGYLNLSVANEDPKKVSFDVIKQLLEKAAARR